jgi:lysophospholipase L1-like esterase
MRTNRFQAMTVMILAGVLLAAAGRAQEIPVKTGDKIAFLGDSITAGGMHSNGYCRLVISGLAANGIQAEPIGAGVSGHKSNQMLARLDKDVIAKKPTWMTLSCGVNDVWHGANGVELPDYKKNITEIVDKAQAAGIKVMILTATMIKEDAENDLNKKLAGYNDFLRELAKEKKCLLGDLNAEMQATIAEMKKANPLPPGKNYLTSDGVHMALAGNRMMALGLLKGFGLTETHLAKAKQAWDAK